MNPWFLLGVLISLFSPLAACAEVCPAGQIESSPIWPSVPATKYNGGEFGNMTVKCRYNTPWEGVSGTYTASCTVNPFWKLNGDDTEVVITCGATCTLPESSLMLGSCSTGTKYLGGCLSEISQKNQTKDTMFGYGQNLTSCDGLDPFAICKKNYADETALCGKLMSDPTPTTQFTGICCILEPAATPRPKGGGTPSPSPLQ
jgi:hypothetical protein